VLPEYAFIGRSNVGKSSLINYLLQKKNLARVSSTPGKTRLINHFLINDEWMLVDLPGYGYARIAKTEREKWEKMIHDYLMKRKNLLLTFILLDSRIELKKSDLDMINWFGENSLPFVIVFTKADKLKANELNANTSAIKRELEKHWEELPQTIITSSETGYGCEHIIKVITENNKLWSTNQ
jgi:GTP-binding protein